MATPPRRRKAGRIEIENKEREARESAKVNQIKQDPITKEEHEERVKMLKEMGLLK